LPGVSGLPEVFRIFPDIPGLRAATALFYVMEYKSPLHSFLSLSPSLSLSVSLAHFRTATLQNSFTLLFTPLGSKLVRFGGDLRGIESKSLESASELISHL
jgi:hypothetical protein